MELVRNLGVGLTFVFCAVACGGAKKPPSAPTGDASAKAAPEAAEVHEKIAPHTCAARTKLAQLLHEKDARPAQHSEHVSDAAPEAAPPPPPAAAAPGGGPRPASNQTYRTVAPSVALIRNENGMGTGVVIDPKGYILTNYHVVADGQKKDFVFSVDVSFGDLTPTGRMTRQEK